MVGKPTYGPSVIGGQLSVKKKKEEKKTFAITPVHTKLTSLYPT